MEAFAKFVSRNTSEGLKIFRYHTEFRSVNGPGEPIGLVVMMNPGEARPLSEGIFKNLQQFEFETEDYVATKPDKTMSKVMRLIKSAYEYNRVNFPNSYTIHVENLFNVREKDSNKALRLAKNLRDADEIMYKSRVLNSYYNFVFFAWGNIEINYQKQKSLIDKYPDAIKVNKLNHKGTILEVNCPVHALYMNTGYFLEAANKKIIGL